MGVVHSQHLWPKGGILRLRGSNVYRSADPHQRVKFCRRFAVQPNAAMRVRGWMDIPLMKTVGGSKLAPIAHGISNVTAWPATSGGYDSIA